MNDEELKVVENMEKYGGSFIKALAKCFYYSDNINFKRLKRAFPDYWKEYADNY